METNQEQMKLDKEPTPKRGKKPKVETKKPETEPKPKQENKQSSLVLISGGNVVFHNHSELGTAAAYLIHTKEAPDHLREGGVPAVSAALMLCAQRGLPQTAMNQMAYIKGKLTCFGSLNTALVERHKDYGEKQEFFVDRECNKICVDNKNLFEKPYAAVVRIKKKKSSEWNEFFYTKDDANEAGLLNPKRRDGTIISDSPWLKYVKDMLMHKARARAYRSEYASALEGIVYHEDMSEVVGKERNVTDTATEPLSKVMNDFSDVDIDNDKYADTLREVGVVNG